MKARFVNESRSYSQKKIVETILEPIAEELGVPLTKGKKDVQTVMTYTKVTTQYYKLGDLDIFLRERKVPGMGADDPEIWVLDRDDPGRGRKFYPGWGTTDLKNYIAQELGKGHSSNAPKEIQLKYNEEKLQRLINDLRKEFIKDDEAFDIADGILREDPDLATYLRVHKKIKDPQGWLADQL